MSSAVDLLESSWAVPAGELVCTEKSALSGKGAGYAAAQALLNRLKQHHAPTAAHSTRVAKVIMAVWSQEPERLGDPEPLLIGGVLHDLGKLFVPAETLDSNRALDAREREMIRRHPEAGAEVLQMLGFSPVIVAAARDHHERWEGGGYPSGCPGTQLDPLARLTAVADAYVAMVEPGRKYRKPLGHAAALQEIKACRGTHFDPAAADQLTAALAGQAGQIIDAYTS
jgi:putative nucleotidyltransferase with HDIG domain